MGLESINNLKKRILYLFERPTTNEELIKKTIGEGVKQTVSAFVLKLEADKNLGAQEIKKLLYDCAEENGARDLERLWVFVGLVLLEKWKTQMLLK